MVNFQRLTPRHFRPRCRDNNKKARNTKKNNKITPKHLEKTETATESRQKCYQLLDANISDGRHFESVVALAQLSDHSERASGYMSSFCLPL